MQIVDKSIYAPRSKQDSHVVASGSSRTQTSDEIEIDRLRNGLELIDALLTRDFKQSALILVRELLYDRKADDAENK